MLQLLFLICVVVLTIQAFLKKGVVAGLVMSLALLLSVIGAFMPRPLDGSFPVAFIFTFLGLIVLIFGSVKWFRKAKTTS
jgi:hypothetical protein